VVEAELEMGSGVPNPHLKETEPWMKISDPFDEQSKISELWRVSDSWPELKIS